MTLALFLATLLDCSLEKNSELLSFLQQFSSFLTLVKSEPMSREKLCQELAANFFLSLRAKWQIGQPCPRNQTQGNILPPSSCGQPPTIDRPVTSNLGNNAPGLTMTNCNCFSYFKCICITSPLSDLWGHTGLNVPLWSIMGIIMLCLHFDYCDGKPVT